MRFIAQAEPDGYTNNAAEPALRGIAVGRHKLDLCRFR
jgi:hypothetical protein